MNDFQVFAEKFGFPALVLLIIIVSFWRSVTYLGKKLFDDNKGILTRISNTHIKFVESVDNSVKKIAEISSSQNKALNDTKNLQLELLQLHKDPTSVFSTKKTNKTLIIISEILIELADERNNPNVSEKIRQKVAEIRAIMK